MKKIRLLFVSVSIMLLFGLMSCGVSGVFMNNPVLADDDQAIVSEPNPTNGIPFKVTMSDHNGFKGVKRIDTYDEFLSVFSESDIRDQYNEAFFNTSSIVFYSTWAGSGSIHYEVTSLELDSNRLIVNVKQDIPAIGTCDMRYWGFVIEYAKPETPITEVVLNVTTTMVEYKTFYIEDEEDINEIKTFINSMNNDLLNVELNIGFVDDFSMDVSNAEMKAYYDSVNNEKVVQYKIDQLNYSSIYISSYSASVYIGYQNFDMNELDEIYDIALNEGVSRVIVTVHYKVIK